MHRAVERYGVSNGAVEDAWPQPTPALSPLLDQDEGKGEIGIN